MAAVCAGVLAWHVPALFDAALDSLPLHMMEHLTFAVVAWLFWRVVLVREESEPVLIVMVFTTMLYTGILGVLMIFAGSVWYPQYAGAHGLTALQDQQLAGTVMWVPMNALLFLVLLQLGYRWLSREQAPAPSI